MTLRKILAATCLLLPLVASAHNFETNQRVPPVGIADRGELMLDNDKFSYKNGIAPSFRQSAGCATYCRSDLCQREERRAD